MNKSAPNSDLPARLERAKARAERAEARTQEAKTRIELAQTRAEMAESRAEMAKTRTEQAEIRTEQALTRTEHAETRAERAEAILERVVHKKVGLLQEIVKQLPNAPPSEPSRDQSAADTAGNDQKSQLESLTTRQREVLELIALGRNTKQIADLLKISAKTVEYHRLKLMAALDLHDIPALVRYALRMGLLPRDG